MTKRALIVVDIQNDYFEGGKWPLHGMDCAAGNAARLIASARKSGELIVHIRHEFPNPDAPFFVPRSDGARIHGKVLPNNSEQVILKNHVNVFRETKLVALLNQEGVTDVSICGAMSHMCIDAAVRAAGDLGLAVTVVHDACAACDLEFNGVIVPAEQVHAAFMAALEFGYASTQSTNEYLEQDPVQI